MRLIVERNNSIVNELEFKSGPIHIGRHASSQVILSDMSVSRKHTKIFVNEDKWIVEDLDSANKTYLNEEAIHRAEIKSGDVLQIGDFTIKIGFENDVDKDIKHSPESDDTLVLEASLSTPRDEVIVRKPDAAHSPAMRLAAKRLTDFSQATESICKAENLDELMRALLDITMQQFTALHVWCGLRSQVAGPITYQAGKRRDGKSVELSDIKLNDKITHVLERGQSLVLPQVAASLEETERIRSALIVTIKNSKGCYGVLYTDNAMVHKHYNLGDLDYLMFLTMHVAAILKNYL